MTNYIAPSRVTIATGQPALLPNPLPSGCVVTNVSTSTTVDIAPSPLFQAGTITTVAAGNSAQVVAGQPIWCRVTPGQSGNPQSADVIAAPGGAIMPPAIVGITNTAKFVTVPDPAAGADWAYTIPAGSPLRLVSLTAKLTTSSANTTRLPFLWQIVSGDTTPTQVNLLSADGLPGGGDFLLSAAPGSSPNTRTYEGVLANGNVPTTATVVYNNPGGGTTSAGTIWLDNPTSGSITVTMLRGALGGGFQQIWQGAVASATTTVVAVPAIEIGWDLQLVASAGGVVFQYSAVEMPDARRAASFTGLLLPVGSTVQSAIAFIQAADQWSQINLAFVQS